ncbi:MAG: hypothetical protein US69_C0008G0008 [candidate division TM6 bacterium GW2011_GWF2_38_10]|nr:MAG: hypothetical protein US69_C0008G0008 [candidate division TM6 bacterium GW2011_GWF2_38_10]
MKKFLWLFAGVFLSAGVFTLSAQIINSGAWELSSHTSTTLDSGTYAPSGLVYNDQVALENNNHYCGVIYFNHGFSLDSGHVAYLDLLQPVSGDIDLNDTASLVLENDLVLAPGVQLLSGGTIEADGATLLLQGDCTIPASKILTLQGTITIDGNGNKLIFADDAQLKAASDAIIVMKNMTLKTTGTTNTLPLIDNGASGCLVTLDNIAFDFNYDVALSTDALVAQQAITNALHGVLPNTNIFSVDGATLLLQGDTSISAGKVIHCAGDIVIDGGGRTVYFEPHAQLMADANSTVTLRNMIISPERMGAATPALECDASGKLCLDNVVLNLSNDLQIDQGSIFVHNDVVVSGTSALLYQSPRLLSIAPHGTLYFDTGATFSFAPKSAALERLQLGSATSRLMFNGADFITTGDDLQFMRGQVLFDGLSHLDHHSAELFEGFDNPIKTLTQNIPNIRVASWSPDGSMLLVGYGEEGLNKQHSIQLYSFDGITLALQGSVINYDYDTYFSRYVTSIAWSPDGAYVVVGTGRNGDLMGGYYVYDGRWYIYSVGVSGLTLVKDGSVSSLSEFINKVVWSPEGDFISIGGFEADSWDESSYYYDKKLYVYSFNRNDNSVTNVTNSDIGAISNSISWAPDLWDDYYVALGFPGFGADGWPVVPALFDDGSPEEIRVYKDSAKNGAMTLFKTKENVTGCKHVAWSPDGNWIAAARGDNGVTVYQWTGSDFGATEVSVALSGVMSVDWFANSEYLAVGYTNDIKIYAFDGVSLTDTGIAFDSMPGIKNVHWVPDDGAHLLGRYTNNLDIFNTEFKQELIPATGKSIIFGDGVNPEHDCDVTMLSGARVLLSGNLVYNPVV